MNAGKDDVRASLRVEQPGPRYMHIPADRDIGWFQQLLAERLAQKRVNGAVFYVWEPLPGRANEALDCRVYALAALRGLLHRGLKLNARADRVGAAVTIVEPDPGGADEATRDEMNAVTQAPAAEAVEVRKPGSPAPRAAAAAPPPAPAAPAASAPPVAAAKVKPDAKDRAQRLAERLARMK